MANGTTYLTRTLSSGTTNTKGTFSFWLKRGDAENATYQGLFANRPNSTSNENLFQILLQKNDNGAGVQMAFWNSSGVMTGNKRTSTSLRDLSGWYHIVCTIDTTLTTADDRMKIYINGERITDFASSPNATPSQNDTFSFFNNHSNHKQVIGSLYFTSNLSLQSKLNGSLSHVHACDGYAYDASAFGSTDATTGEWKINTSPSVTYGTNGFFILKDGNSVTDQSGNGNNFTVAGGTLTKTEDSPSNVFATFNALIGKHSNGNTLVPNLDAGNTDAWINASEWRIAQSTLGASSGKYYAEFKQSNDYGTDYAYIGIYDIDSYAQKISGYPYLPDMANCFSILNTNGNVYSGASDLGSYGTSFANGDIIGCAIDLNNNKIYWSKNGVWMNSANYMIPTT